MRTKAQRMLKAPAKTDKTAEPEAEEVVPSSSGSVTVEDLTPAGDPDFVQEPEAGADEALGEAASGPELMGPDEFYQMFQFLFAAPNMLPVEPFPIEALPISDGETDRARKASDTVYEICAESEHLRWLIEPQSLWVQRLMVIGAFAVPKAQAVLSELHQRGARPRAKAAAQAKASPADAAPMPPGAVPFTDPFAGAPA